MNNLIAFQDDLLVYSMSYLRIDEIANFPAVCKELRNIYFCNLPAILADQIAEKEMTLEKIKELLQKNKIILCRANVETSKCNILSPIFFRTICKAGYALDKRQEFFNARRKQTHMTLSAPNAESIPNAMYLPRCAIDQKQQVSIMLSSGSVLILVFPEAISLSPRGYYRALRQEQRLPSVLPSSNNIERLQKLFNLKNFELDQVIAEINSNFQKHPDLRTLIYDYAT